MKLEEYRTSPSHAQQDLRDEWKCVVEGLDGSLKEAFKDFISNPIELAELAETKILPTLHYSGEDWMSPLNDFALPDEWVFTYVVTKVIPELRKNLAKGIMDYSSNEALINHPRIAEATDLFKSLGTFKGRQEAVELILAAKIDRETRFNK